MGSVDGCGLVFQKKLYALCIAPAILILSRLWILSCVCVYICQYIYKQEIKYTVIYRNMPDGCRYSGISHADVPLI